MRASLIVSLAALSCASAAWGQGVVFFTNQQAFHQFNTLDGKFLKGIETFENNNLPPGGKQNLPDPLMGGVPNVSPATGMGFPLGLENDNLVIQANVLPGPHAPFPAPSGDPFALYVVTPPFLGVPSSMIGEDLFLSGVNASIDLIFTSNDKTGVGFELSRYAGFPMGGWDIAVFDTANNFVGSFIVPPPPGAQPASVFFGVWAPSIGRINIFDMAGASPEGIDNIEMWVPAPGSLVLLGLAGLGLRRRR